MEQMQSEQINELAAAMAKMQGELESAAKSSSNPYFNSKYADLATVWDVCREPLSKNNLALIQQLANEGEKTILITTLMHGSGQWIRSIVPILITPRVNKQGIATMDPQCVGSAITYFRRYAMTAMLGITQDDDDGNSASGITSKATTEKQLNEIIDQLIEEFPFEKKDVAGKYLEHCRAHYKAKKGSKWVEVLHGELTNATNDVESFIKSVYAWDEKRSSPKA